MHCIIHNGCILFVVGRISLFEIKSTVLGYILWLSVRLLLGLCDKGKLRVHFWVRLNIIEGLSFSAWIKEGISVSG